MQIRFSYDSLLDWSEPDEGVQIFLGGRGDLGTGLRMRQNAYD